MASSLQIGLRLSRHALDQLHIFYFEDAKILEKQNNLNKWLITENTSKNIKLIPTTNQIQIYYPNNILSL